MISGKTHERVGITTTPRSVMGADMQIEVWTGQKAVFLPSASGHYPWCVCVCAGLASRERRQARADKHELHDWTKSMDT